MFQIKSKKRKISTFNLSKVERFLIEEKNIESIIYNNSKCKLSLLIKIIFKMNGNFSLHLELHKKFFGNHNLKSYLNGKKLQKF